MPLRKLELARVEQLKAEFATDSVRRRVVDVREGMHEAALVAGLGELDRLRGRGHRDAAALEFGHDHPTDLIDLLVTPLSRPEADRPDPGSARRVDDLEHAIAPLEALVAALTLAQLVRALGAAEVLGHARVAHQTFEQRQVAAAPGLEGHRRAHSTQPRGRRPSASVRCPDETSLARAYARDMADRFETAYLEGSPPWDIGRAQPELVSLVEAGRITGRVIDLGCGSGENAISFAMAGLEVVGVDGSPEAIRQARDKAVNRGVSIRFDVADVLDLVGHRESFDTATDSGVFHVFDDEDRPRYAHSVRGVLGPGGHLFLLCFSEREPGDWGPRRVTQRELRETFTDGWQVDSIDRARLDTQIEDAQQVEAWLAAITRL